MDTKTNNSTTDDYNVFLKYLSERNNEEMNELDKMLKLKRNLEKSKDEEKLEEAEKPKKR